MDESDRTEARETTRLLHELLGAVRGINGDGGLIGRVATIDKNVTDIKVVLPTLTTKVECAESRKTCSAAKLSETDHRYLRAKDRIIIGYATLTAIGTIIGITKAVGWW